MENIIEYWMPFEDFVKTHPHVKDEYMILFNNYVVLYKIVGFESNPYIKCFYFCLEDAVKDLKYINLG